MAPEDDALYAVAATQVLETGELTEMILLNLSQKEIMKMQAVTQTIKNTIAGSHKLQRKMYRRQRVPWEKADNSISDINPVLFPSVDTLSFRLHNKPGSAFTMHHRPSRTTRTGEMTSDIFTLLIADEEDWRPALPSFLPEGYLETFPCSQVGTLPLQISSSVKSTGPVKVYAVMAPGWTLREIIHEVSLYLKTRATWAKEHGMFVYMDEDDSSDC